MRLILTTLYLYLVCTNIQTPLNREISNDCFGLNNIASILLQAKIGLEQWVTMYDVVAYGHTRAYLFSTDEGSCYAVSTQKNSYVCLHMLFVRLKVFQFNFSEPDMEDSIHYN